MIPIYEADRLEDLPLFDRPPQAEEDVDAAVAAILADVRTRGDEACGNTPAGSTAQIWSGLR